MPQYGTFFLASRREQLHERLPEGNFKRTHPPSRLWALQGGQQRLDDYARPCLPDALSGGSMLLGLLGNPA
jgi:hypothetical protein